MLPQCHPGPMELGLGGAGRQAQHADAGYEIAIETARERGVDLPMING